MNKSIFIILSTILLFQISCAPIKDKKSFTYFNNLPADSIYIVDDPGANIEKKLKPGDRLSIIVVTKDGTTNALINNGILINNNSGGTNSQPLIYKIDNNGNIQMPVIGNLNLNGKTLEETQQLIAQKVSIQAKDPIVSIQLLNAQIMVMGEVNSPGLINISDRRTTILEAIGLAGDVKSMGSKSNILIQRSENGKKINAHVNLNDISSINSPYYYLRQDDVVIVNPNELREKQERGAFTGIQATQLAIGILGSSLGLISIILQISNNK